MSYCKGPDIEEPLSNEEPSTSVLKILEDALRQNGESIVMVEGDTGRSVSRAGLLERSLRLGAGLRGAGVVAGDCVVLCCDKSILSYSLLLATMFNGATAVVVPTTYADRIYRLTKGKIVKAVFFDPKFQKSVLEMSVPFIEPAPLLTAVINQEDQYMTATFHLFDYFTVFEPTDMKLHVPIVLFSSGTTGEPKGIQLSDIGLRHPPFKYFGRSLAITIPILILSPLFWYSAIQFLSFCIQQNCTLVLGDNSSTEEALKLVQTYRIHTLFVGSGFLLKMTRDPLLQNYDKSSIKSVTIGGDIVPSSVSESIVKTVFKGNIKLRSIYGSTETGTLTQCLNVEGLGHVGCPYPGVEIKIVDEEGSVVPVGQVGHVMSRSPALTPGYLDGRQLPIDHEGFFRLEDIGYMDKRGHLHLKGRLIDMIVYRGVAVSPWEIEDVLLSHPGVANAAVVGRPHPSDGQRPTAFVVRRAGSDVTGDHLAAFVEGKVEEIKKLRGGVIFIDTLPLTIIDKINRKILRDTLV